MACRAVATILLIYAFATASFSQTTAAPQTPAAAAAPTEPPRKTLPSAPQAKTGTIVGTATDVSDAIIPGATAVLEGPVRSNHLTQVANDRGFFEFTAVQPGTYRITVSAKGFANWNSPAVVLHPGQAVILTGCKLKVAEAKTTLYVGYTAEQIATEQVKVQEQQRVFGIFPNFYVSYDPDAAPLTTKLKYRLALRTSVDPITFVGVALLAGAEQAADRPDYDQGAKGYGQRFGAFYADGFIDIIVGGAVLPSLLHQDPRYFYQGTGTKTSRILHAMSSPFVCKGDNGKLQPNYSSIGGDLATAAVSNAYYPPSDRGAGLVFQNVLIDTAERVAADLAQEFLFRKLTPKLKKQN